MDEPKPAICGLAVNSIAARDLSAYFSELMVRVWALEWGVDDAKLLQIALGSAVESEGSWSDDAAPSGKVFAAPAAPVADAGAELSVPVVEVMAIGNAVEVQFDGKNYPVRDDAEECCAELSEAVAAAGLQSVVLRTDRGLAYRHVRLVFHVLAKQGVSDIRYSHAPR